MLTIHDIDAIGKAARDAQRAIDEVAAPLAQFEQRWRESVSTLVQPHVLDVQRAIQQLSTPALDLTRSMQPFSILLAEFMQPAARISELVTSTASLFHSAPLHTAITRTLQPACDLTRLFSSSAQAASLLLAEVTRALQPVQSMRRAAEEFEVARAYVIDVVRDPSRSHELRETPEGIEWLEYLAASPYVPADARMLARYHLAQVRRVPLHRAEYTRLAAELDSRASAMDLTPDQRQRTPGAPADAWREAVAQSVAFVGDDDDWLAAARREALRDLYAAQPPILDTRRDGERIVVPRTVPLSAFTCLDVARASDDLAADDDSDVHERLSRLWALASEAERRALLDALRAIERGEPLAPRVRQALSRLRRRVART